MNMGKLLNVHIDYFLSALDNASCILLNLDNAYKCTRSPVRTCTRSSVRTQLFLQNKRQEINVLRYILI